MTLHLTRYEIERLLDVLEQAIMDDRSTAHEIEAYRVLIAQIIAQTGVEW